MIDLGGVFPLFVEVVSRDVGSVVPVDDSVWVQHRHYFEDEVLSEFPGLFVCRDEEFDDAIADVGAD